MNFTIEEVNSAWMEFIKPTFLVGGEGEIKELENHSVIETDDVNKIKLVSKGDFISFLIDWKTRAQKTKSKNSKK